MSLEKVKTELECVDSPGYGPIFQHSPSFQVKNEEKEENPDPDYSWDKVEVSNLPDIKPSDENLKAAQQERDEINMVAVASIKVTSGKSSRSAKNVLEHCLLCGKQYKHMQSHIIHIHCKKSKGYFSCNQCHQVCKDKPKFVKHFTSKHNKTRSRKQKSLPEDSGDVYVKVPKVYRCLDCDLEFDKAHAYCAHRKAHKKPNSKEVFKKYMCDFCCKSYALKSTLNSHVKRYHRTDSKSKSGPVRCTYCLQIYPNHSELKVHVKQCKSHSLTAQTPPCEICSRTFTKMWQLENHKRSHPISEWKVMCKKCKLGFMKSEDLELHTKLKECKDEIVCGTCNNTFLTKPNLIRHMREVHKEGTTGSTITKVPLQMFSCTVCNKEFKQRAHLTRHMVLHSDNPRPHHCDQCSKSFSEPHQLRRHMLIHTGKYPAKCNQCECEFRTMYDLNLHRELIHSSGSRISIAKRGKCKFCGMQFLLKNRLDEHERIHTNERPLKCNLCGETFKTYAAKYQHKWKHMNRKFKCEKCNKTCKTYLSHYHHQQRCSTRSDLNSFACDRCGKSFRGLDILTKCHQKQSNTRPFKCKFCCKSFRNNGSLLTHRAEKHDKKARYNCITCSAKFSTHSVMIDHVRMHLKKQGNIKLLKCHHPDCNGTFLKMHSLERHLCKEHGSISALERPKNFDLHATRVIMNCATNERDSGNKKHNMPVLSEIRVKITSPRKEVHEVGSPLADKLTPRAIIHKGVAGDANTDLICMTCGILFSTAELLQIHMVVHTGAKPFSCDICGKAFATSFALNKHKSAKH